MRTMPLVKKISKEDKLIQLGAMEESILKEELKVLEKLNNQPTNINLNVKYELVTQPSPVKVTQKSVYFDPLLQLLDTQIQADPINSERSLSDTVTPKSTEGEAWEQTNFTATSRPLISDTDDHTKEISGISTTKENKISFEHNDYSEVINNKHNEEILNNPSSESSTQRHSISTRNIDIVASSKVETTTTEPTQASDNSRIPKKLSDADYLKLCFTSGQGCDFSINNNEVKEQTVEVKSTTQTTTTTKNYIIVNTSKGFTSPKPSNSEVEERLKARVRLCFFSGICNDDEVQSFKNRKPDTTTIKAPSRPTTTKPKKKSHKKRLMEERIRMKAYLCFSEGKCS